MTPLPEPAIDYADYMQGYTADQMRQYAAAETARLAAERDAAILDLSKQFRVKLAERDAEIAKLHEAMADLQNLESNADQKREYWYGRYHACSDTIAAQRKVLEQALWALQYNNNYFNKKQALEAITAIQEQLK